MGPPRYHLIEERMNWDAAEKYCRSNSWRLAFIAVKDQQLQISNFLDNKFAGKYCSYIKE